MVKIAKETSQTMRIMIADAYPIVCSGIHNIISLQDDLCVVADAKKSDEVMRFVERSAPDVLLIDSNMPNLRIADVLQYLGTLPTPPKALIFSAQCAINGVLDLLKAGARGYVLKSEEPAKIIAALRAVMQGEVWLSATITAQMVDSTLYGKKESEQDILSFREREVLEQLAAGRDNIEIGAALYISERTVRYHLRNIYDKLGLQRRGEAIAWAVRHDIGALSLSSEHGRRLSG